MKSLLVLLAVLKTAACACCREEHRRDFVCRRERHWSGDFRGTFPESSEVVSARRHERGLLTKHEYVHAVYNFLKAKYWRSSLPPSRREVKNALGIIYEMLHRNIHGLVVFTSHVVFGTGGLLRLQAGTGQWTSRGILQITGEGNYGRLAQITGSEFFLCQPHALATLQRYAVEASVLFWLCLVRERFGDYEKAKISFWETLLLLNPGEAQWPGSPENSEKIRNRMSDYDELHFVLECRY